MIQAAATFGAGIMAAQKIGSSCGCQGPLPSCRLRNAGDDEGTNFKLAVHVHAAAAPELNEPGMLMRPRPQLQALLGDVRTETAFADYASPDERAKSGLSNGKAAFLGASEATLAECAWRFGDTLTFNVGLSDILGEGLWLQLCARSDLCLGPLQMQLPSTQELGETMLDLRRRVLPACEPAVSSGNRGFGGTGRPEWTSPTLVVPLTRRGLGSQMAIVARVVVSFSVNVDPEVLLRDARCVEQPFVETMTQCLQAPSRLCGRPGETRRAGFCGPQGMCGHSTTSEPDFHTDAPLVVQVCVMSPEAAPSKRSEKKDCMTSSVKF